MVKLALSGTISTGTAKDLLDVITRKSDLVEVAELAKRLEALEDG